MQELIFYFLKSTQIVRIIREHAQKKQCKKKIQPKGINKAH